MTLVKYYNNDVHFLSVNVDQIPSNGVRIHFDGHTYEIIRQDWFYDFDGFSNCVKLESADVYVKEVL